MKRRQHSAAPAPSPARCLLTLACALAYCGLCGAFLPPPTATTTTTATAAFHPRALSSSPSGRGQGRSSRTSIVRMQHGGSSSSDQELHVAVSRLAEQVEELTAMVAQLAGQPAGDAGSSAKGINGAVVGGGSVAVQVVPVTKAKDDSSAPLVSTSAAQQRIDQWLQESGGGVAAAPAKPAAPAAQPAAPAPAVLPEVAAPPAEADSAPADSGFKVKIEWEGAIHEVTCDAETTLLEAAMDAGLELPSSCMSGSCLTCPGKIVSGSVDQSEGVLEDDQTEAGFLLTCVSYPQSDVHFAVVDEEDLP
ncbi:unnamed protein product [Pylaiella littoralis]